MASKKRCLIPWVRIRGEAVYSEGEDLSATGLILQ